MSKAVDPFGPQGSGGGDRPPSHEVREERLAPDWQARRDRAVWYAVVGIGLMFAGQISTAFAIGGAGMVLFGIIEYVRWSLKRPRADDPWRDPDLDAWEEHHYGEGDGLDSDAEADAPDLGDSDPDRAWGGRDRRP